MQQKLVRLVCGTAVLLLAAPAPGGAQDGWQSERIDPAEYGGAADEISPAAAETLLLELINSERAKHAAAPLALDEAAGELAWERAQELAAAGTASHYDELGRKVEQRFNLRGRTDHATENLLVYEIGAKVFLTPQLVRRMHQHWLAEPGHRANLLDPAHTALGAGFALSATDGTTTAAAATVFVNDYGDADRLPPRVSSGSHHWLTGCLTPGPAQFGGIALALEPLKAVQPPPDPQHYSMPAAAIVYLADDTEYEAQGTPPYEIREVDYNPDTGYFSVRLYFPRHWSAGRVYVTLWARSASAGDFPAMTQVLELAEPAVETP